LPSAICDFVFLFSCRSFVIPLPPRLCFSSRRVHSLRPRQIISYRMNKRLSLFPLVPLLVVLPCHAADLPSDLLKQQSRDLTLVSTGAKSASPKNGATGSDSDLFFLNGPGPFYHAHNPRSLDLVLISARTDQKSSPTVETATLRPAPHKWGDIVRDSDWSILPRTDLYELGASKLSLSSIRNLPASGFRKLTQAEATFFVGDYYSCPPGKSPYLVKAVYSARGFGQFRAERHGSSLAIIWGTVRVPEINQDEDYRPSAVVVNLDFTPDEVYTELSSAL